jgi:hypothetical protein
MHCICILFLYQVNFDRLSQLHAVNVDCEETQFIIIHQEGKLER